jgi:N-formylglutamate amidohydrolase
MIYNYYKATNKFKGLISIPHSGLIIPNEFKEYLIDDEKILNTDNDYKVNELIDVKQLNNNGIDVIVYNINRVCIDLNRDIQNCFLFWKTNTLNQQLVIKEAYNIKNDLVFKYYLSYFNMIKEIYSKINYKTFIIDLHSMPSKTTDYHLKNNKNQSINRPDFCLSDLNGISCDKNFITNINKNFIENNYNSKINDPYFGGYLTKFFHEHFNVDNIQIEINRKLYMNEDNKQLYSNNLKEILTNLFCKL